MLTRFVTRWPALIPSARRLVHSARRRPRRLAAGAVVACVVVSLVVACTNAKDGNITVANAPILGPVATVDTTIVTASADSWIAQPQSKKNFGLRDFIMLRDSRESGLLRFDVPVIPDWRVTSATLKLNSGKVPGNGVSIYTTGGTWAESQVSWSNAPAGIGLLGTSGTFEPGSWVSWDVTKAVPPAGGVVNLRVENPSSTWMGFLSRESGQTTAPQLVVTRTRTLGPIPMTTASASLAPWIAPQLATPKPSAKRGAPGVKAAKASSAVAVSGSTVPGAISGWKQVFSDDFTGNRLGSGWGAYSGGIPSMPGGRWDPSHVQVADGKLRLLTSDVNGRWTSGGLMNSVQARTTYGKYLVRFRMDRASGVKYALLLWPASGRWPMDGEIDFAEDGGGQRKGTTGTLHGGTSSSHQQVQRHVAANFSNWHTVGVEWTPGKVVYTLDGKAWGTVQTWNAPTKPMNLALQTEAGSCSKWMSCLDSATPATTALEVDWVAVYTRK